ncbi:MAG: hypothetical protein AAGG75_14985 [Bacteroidota bacterium]
MKNWTAKIPHLYFIAIIFWIYRDNLHSADPSLTVLLFAIPFAYQLFYNKHWLNLVLGSIAGFYSFWMFMAYLSDLAKPAVEGYTRFALIGGSFVLLNFLMVYLLFKGCLAQKDRVEYQHWQMH